MLSSSISSAVCRNARVPPYSGLITQFFENSRRFGAKLPGVDVCLTPTIRESFSIRSYASAPSEWKANPGKPLNEMSPLAQAFIRSRWFKWLSVLFGYTSRRATRLWAASQHARAIEDHLTSSGFIKHFGLDQTPPGFRGWYSASILHVWMLLVRLRQEGKEGNPIGQDIFNAFWKDVERRMVAAGIRNPIILSKELKSHAYQYYGMVVAFDEGLIEGDAVLADALWRNVLDTKAGSVQQVEQLVIYVKRQLRHLDKMPSELFLQGRVMVWAPIDAEPVESYPEPAVASATEPVKEPAPNSERA
eukprot:TRINITY_DN27953_c0_g1_i1.p1 TRINITY_DN27953_c0_g1~~TRINITY_DN27953_c0_g1_i1.p1  ORF type:complete len:304 (-),score=56.58 TRINITY_DN27953_c0_g1_i1:88-999(-)